MDSWIGTKTDISADRWRGKLDVNVHMCTCNHVHMHSRHIYTHIRTVLLHTHVRTPIHAYPTYTQMCTYISCIYTDVDKGRWECVCQGVALLTQDFPKARFLHPRTAQFASTRAFNQQRALGQYLVIPSPDY